MEGPGGSQLLGTLCVCSLAPWQDLVSKAHGPSRHGSSSTPKVQLLVECGLKAV